MFKTLLPLLCSVLLPGYLLASTVDAPFLVSSSDLSGTQTHCSAETCSTYAFHDWASPGASTVRLADAGRFYFSGADIQGMAQRYMVSGASENPLPPRSELNAMDIDELQATLDVYYDWLVEGGAPTDFHYFISGYLNGVRVLHSTFRPDFYRCAPIDGCVGTLNERVSLTDRIVLDTLTFGISLPTPFETASFFDARPYNVGPNGSSCYYGCWSDFSASNLQISPVPLPAPALLLLFALTTLGGISRMVARPRYSA